MVFVLCCIIWIGSLNGFSSESDVPETAEGFFQDTKVWEVELSVTPENYAALEPNGGPDFGADFDYVSADVSMAGQAFKNVGLRYKGNSSYSTARSIPKKSFKIDFNHFVKGQKFLGLTKVNLNNNVLDPSQIREALAYRLWRRMELPASRTAFARVSLTVPGHFEREILGLYVIVEQVNGPYLKRHFENDNGLLLKPERCLSTPYLGESFADYETVYSPKSPVIPDFAERLIAFTRLIHKAEDAEFANLIETFVDLKQLAKFMAVHTVLSHLDSFLLRGHNFYLYLPNADGRFAFMPWDVNSTFASHRSAGSPEQQFNLSVSHPFAEDQRLLGRLMKIEVFGEFYGTAMDELVATHFSKASITNDMNELGNVVAKHVKEDPFSSYGAFMANFKPAEPAGVDSDQHELTFGRFPVIRKPLLWEFVIRRHESIAAQLAGEQEGYVPGLRQRK